ncbi:MAG TPA: ABC transporter permease [Bryobacteraceae bacterium]
MSLVADVRLAFRTLLKNPGFTTIAVIMLAVGIGINAAVFTVSDAVLFKGFHFVKRNDRLVYISDNGNCCVSYPDFETYRAEAKSFQGMAIVHGVARILTDQSGFAERYDATEVSAGTFQLVGQRPILGRDFTPADQTPGAPAVAVLSYGFWQSRFGKDPAILGRTVRMSNTPTMVIGVMPQGFSFPQKVDLWVPLVVTSEVRKRENRDTWFVLGRLKDGVSFETARAEIATIAARLAAAYPLTNRDLHITVQNFGEFMIGPNVAALYGSMWGAVGFVLLIACANLANLELARAVGRAREISLRIALGAGRWRIIRQLLVESVLLSCLGGVGGWWIAKWGVRAYQLAMAQKASWLILDYTMDRTVLAYLIAISIGTGILFGIAPALRLSRLHINSALKDGGHGAISGARGRHLSSVLVTGEMTLAIVLLAGAGVMIRSYLKIHTANMGVKVANLLVGTQLGGLPPDRYSTPESRISYFDRLKAQLEAVPGVESVATASVLPSWRSRPLPYELAGEPPVEPARRPQVEVMAISPGYFRTMSAAIVSGRDFNNADIPHGPPVAIVNQKFANVLWPGKDPLGRRLRLFEGWITGTAPGPWLTVVGVASNIIQNDVNRQEFGPVIYLPYRQLAEGSAWFLARTRIPPAGLVAAFRRELRTVDPDLPIYGPFLLQDRLEFFWNNRFYGLIFLVFAAVALLLASVGLYAVIAHSVSQRTREIGLRMAMGASAGNVLLLVFRQGMLPLAIGLAIGLAASLALNRLFTSLLVQVSPSDPLTLMLTSAVLVVAAAIGCFIPARRAMRLDPAVALRHD